MFAKKLSDHISNKLVFCNFLQYLFTLKIRSILLTLIVIQTKTQKEVFTLHILLILLRYQAAV